MKTKIVGILCFVCSLSTTVFAQSTAFTYQGRLQHGGTPATGLYEMNFTLYDALTAGAPVGAGVTLAPVPVTNGLFTVALNFGPAPFMGVDRWLEIAVTPFGSDQPVVPLAPRQPLTPTPYAMHAYNAGALMSPGNVPLDIKINGVRALRLEPAVSGNNSAFNLIAGNPGNLVEPGIVGAVVLGGGNGDHPVNVVGADFSSISGGSGHRIEVGANHSSIAGGNACRIEDYAYYSFIGGGIENVIESGVIGGTSPGGIANSVGAGLSVIGGGIGNRIEFEAGSSTISGGDQNRISVDADWAVIGGGAVNLIQIDGAYSVIGGGEANQIGMDSLWAVIGGGKRNTIAQSASFSTVSGGEQNESGGDHTTVGGGGSNRIGDDTSAATIGGGFENFIHPGGGSSTISGGNGNEIYPGTAGATMGGGIQQVIGAAATCSTIGGGRQNHIGDNATNATIAGGLQNTAAGVFATVGGGGDNVASGFGAVIAGGGGIQFSDGNEPRGNTASGVWSAIGGGADNVASGVFSVVGGGEFNRASGINAMVPGGLDCEASGTLSFAAGWGAKALHAGSFVWADHSPTFGGPPFESTANNQFKARAAGGVRFFTDAAATTGAELAPGSGTWSSLSDRNAKENFAAANAREILDKVTALPLATWNYKTQDESIRHLGPMAQDFHAAFGLGESERTITTVDADGVALAAIQGLNQKLEQAVQAKDAEIRELKQSMAELKALVGALADARKGGAR